MKAFLMACLMLTSAPVAHGNPVELFRCKTGDALGDVKIFGDSATKTTEIIQLVITYQSSATKTLSVNLPLGSLKKALKRGQVIHTFRSAESQEFGGAISYAGLLVLKKTKSGSFDGQLAFAESVYALSCQ